MYNRNIRNIKIEKREGSVLYIKTILKKSQIKIGDWIILKIRNLIDNKEVIFPANVRSNYKINIRKSIRSKLGLRFDIKTPVESEVIKKLERISLENKEIKSVSNNLIKILPNSVKINDEIIKLNCFKWQNNKIIFSYQNSKSSNYIIMDKNFLFDSFIVGLWRTEGGKHSLTRSALQFTNSNPKVVQKWLSFIHSMGFSNNNPRLSYYIQYISSKRDPKREKALIKFWSEKLGISKNQFKFIYKQGPGHKAKFYGSVQIKFNNSTLSFIIQYLFMKFENSILLGNWNEDVVIDYIKGTLCDCDCLLKNNSLSQIRFSTSCKEEAELYHKILLKYFNINSKIFPDKRNKCFYVYVGRWDNFSNFLIYNLFDSVSWKGNNKNYNKFCTGILNHLYSRIILCFNKEDTDFNKIINKLVKFKITRKKQSFITLIRRAIDILLLNKFLIKKDKKLILSQKGTETLNCLNKLCSFIPTI